MGSGLAPRAQEGAVERRVHVPPPPPSLRRPEELRNTTSSLLSAEGRDQPSADVAAGPARRAHVAPRGGRVVDSGDPTRAHGARRGLGLQSGEARAARRGRVPPGDQALAERGRDGQARGPAREGLGEHEELPLKGSVQRTGKNWVGQGFYPGTQVTGLKSKGAGAIEASKVALATMVCWRFTPRLQVSQGQRGSAEPSEVNWQLAARPLTFTGDCPSSC
jgi:hypothetical protein